MRAGSSLEEKSSLRGPNRREACSLSDGNYRRPEAEGDRIITENNCRILQSCQVDDGSTREEVAMDVIDQRPQEREVMLQQASRENWA